MGAIQKALAGKTIADNRNAFHEYFIEQRYTAGIVLSGSEVKSIRQAKPNYGAVMPASKAAKRGSTMRILPHTRNRGSISTMTPCANANCCYRRKEISDIFGKITRQGYTFVPLRIFFDNQFVKVELGIAKGKKQHDKRHAIAERDVKRSLDREMKVRNR
jgi:SsrA-binding protein